MRIYGNIKDTKMARITIGTNVKFFLDKKMLQQVKSIENCFFEIITEIDDSRIESGQQLGVTIEKEGYKKQEHRVLTTEGSFNLDVALEPLVVVHIPKRSFNWLPVIIGGGIMLVLIMEGAITWMFISRAKSLKIINFSFGNKDDLNCTHARGQRPFADGPGIFWTRVNTRDSGNHSHSFSTTPSGNHLHSFTTNDATGSGAPIDNRPKFYKLVFIMKLDLKEKVSTA